MFTAQHYVNALTYDVTLPSVGNSVYYASMSMVVDIILGVCIAFLIVRSKLPGFLKQTIDSLAMLPLAVPGLVLAFGFIALSLQLQVYFKDTKWLQNMVNVQQSPTLLLVIAYAMRRLPYVVRSAVAGLEQTPEDLELAAKNLGASSGLTLRRITLPLIAANLVAGGLLAFAFAMLEVSDSLILAQKQNYWPNYQSNLRAIPTPRRRPVCRQRTRRVGDDAAHADDPVGQFIIGQTNGRDLPRLTLM